MVFLKNFEILRNFLNINNSGLEKFLGLSNGYISNIERNGTDNPGKLLVALNEKGISTDWFLTGEGEPFRTLSGIPPGATLGVRLPGAGIVPSENSQPVANLDKGSAIRPANEPSTVIAKTPKVPILKQKVSCGPGIDWESEENIEEYLEIHTLIPRLGIGRVFVLKAQGSSMLGAGIHSGDYVFFDGSDEQKLYDGVYVFALDGDVYCKRLEFDKLAHKIKIFSVRSADLEKAELITSLDTQDSSFSDRFRIFGRVTRCIRLVDIDNKF
jgi:SOS-response transcriptional repressor LexA